MKDIRQAEASEESVGAALESDEAKGPSQAELIGQIRFALSELASSNGQHQFEDLCRHFARERLVPNILPATGPVGTGGDQGRDFETFRTYLLDELGPHGAFAGQLKQGAVAFACTLQKDGLQSKIRQDVAKITASGTPVTAVYVFLVAPLPVATRHKLQEEVRGKHGCELQVFDGPGLSEQLADRDLFWIAEEFLSIPAAFRPPPPEGDDELPAWYRESRDRWRQQGAINPSLGELSNVTDGLRHAVFTPTCRQDLPFWIDLISPLALGAGVPPEVRRRAQYEIAVAHIRGLGTMLPADRLVRSFLDDALTQDDPGVFEDAGVLLSYAGTACSFGHSSLDPTYLATINQDLRQKVTELLEGAPPRTRRARLLAVLGQLSIIPDPQLLEIPDDPEEDAPNTADMIDLAREKGVPDEVIAEMPAVDLPGAMEAWRSLAGLLEETPLFPVEPLAEQLAFLAPLLIDQPGWSEIETAFDAAIERLHGGDAAAARARDRAVRLQDAGRLRDALTEFHKAKMRWWSGDSLRGALLCMLAIAEIYKKLHLPFAAKQYALAVAGTAHASSDDDVVDLVPVAIMKASEMDYSCGAWLSAIEFADVGLMGHAILMDAETDPWLAHNLRNAILTIGMALRAARAFSPEIVPIAEQIAAKHDMLDELNQVEADTDSWDPETWTRLTDAQLMGRPFSDLGPEREIQFAALGTSWTIRAANTFADSRAAERIAAAAQLLLVELADDDVALLPSQIEVNLRVSDTFKDSDPDLSIERDGTRVWIVDVPPADPNASPDAIERFIAETTSILTVILLDVSLLPHTQYLAATERAFERGLWHKVGIGRPYDEMAEVVPSSHFNHEARTAPRPLQEDRPAPIEHIELQWQDGPGPTYDPDEANEMLANRYQSLPKMIPYTLEKVRSSSHFRSLVVELRDQGWLDWHLLTALVNLSLNARLAALGLNKRAAMEQPDAQEKVNRLIREPETPSAVLLDGDKLTAEEMDQGRRMGLPPLLGHWGLAQNGPVRPDAWDQFLDQRYGYWTDDIPHDDPFPS